MNFSPIRTIGTINMPIRKYLGYKNLQEQVHNRENKSPAGTNRLIQNTGR